MPERCPQPLCSVFVLTYKNHEQICQLLALTVVAERI